MIRSSSCSVLERDVAVDHVLDDHDALDGIPEAHDRIDARARLGAMPARAVVARILLGGELLVAHLLQLFLGAVAAIRVACLQELREHFAVPVHAPRLVERALVVAQPQPLHAVQDHLRRFVGGALAVGVLDAQDELAAMTARIQPGEQRRAHAADVQQTGRTRRKAGTDGHGGIVGIGGRYRD